MIIELRSRHQTVITSHNGNGSTTMTATIQQQQQPPTVHLYYANVTNNFHIFPLPLNQSETFKHQCHYVECSLDKFLLSLQPYIPVDDIRIECGSANS